MADKKKAAQEFATAHAGKPVITVENPAWVTQGLKGIVIGWISSYVVVCLQEGTSEAEMSTIADIESILRAPIIFTVGPAVVPADFLARRFMGYTAEALCPVVATQRLDMKAYPHRCQCGAPAYVGVVPAAVQCSSAACRHYKPVFVPEVDYTALQAEIYKALENMKFTTYPTTGFILSVTPSKSTP